MKMDTASCAASRFVAARTKIHSTLKNRSIILYRSFGKFSQKTGYDSRHGVKDEARVMLRLQGTYACPVMLAQNI